MNIYVDSINRMWIYDKTKSEKVWDSICFQSKNFIFNQWNLKYIIMNEYINL